MEWDPEQYKRGNFFQLQINEAFRKGLDTEPSGTILDVGCGDGQYTNLLANTLPQSQILGIDSSADMIQHARQHWTANNLAFEHQNIEYLEQDGVFDCIVSFWCLHWTNIDRSFPNIFHALKPGGRLYAVFSSFSVNSISNTWQELASQNRYTALANRIAHSDNRNREYFPKVNAILGRLPFRKVTMDMKITRIFLPHLDYFRNLLLTMPFMKTIPLEMQDDFIEDMSITFQTMCQRRYGGDLYYETRPIFLEALKDTS